MNARHLEQLIDQAIARGVEVKVNRFSDGLVRTVVIDGV